MNYLDCPRCGDPLQFSHEKEPLRYYVCNDLDCPLEMVAYFHRMDE